MSRQSRIVIPGLQQHVTQRGCRRQKVFFCDTEREIYLQLFQKNANEYGVDTLSYCLMTNHVHHLVVPHKKEMFFVTDCSVSVISHSSATVVLGATFGDNGAEGNGVRLSLDRKPLKF